MLEFDRGTLVLSPADLPEAVVPPGFVADTRIGGRYRAVARHYRRALTHLIRSNVHVIDDARAYDELQLRPRVSKEPWPHQAEAVAAWKAAGRHAMVVLPTGAGKTYVAELAILDTRRSTLVCVPTLDLLAQWATGLSRAFDIEVGTIGGGSFDVRDVTVSTYDSAYLHMDRLGNRFGLVVFDEAHHLPSESFAQAAELCLAPFRLGLTATPERDDGLHDRLAELTGPICYRQSVSGLTGEYLSDYAVERVHVSLTDDERARYDTARAEYRDFVWARGIRMGSPGGWQRFIQESSRSAEGRRAFNAYREQRQLALASESKLVALEALFERHRHDKVLFFAHDNRTVHLVSRRYLVPCITHETPTAERRAILSGLEAGRWRVVGTSRVLNEGVDMPDVSVGIVMSGTGSVREHVQRLGRILRRGEGKRATLYELVTADTVDQFTSERRREHEAYKRGGDADG